MLGMLMETKELGHMLDAVCFTAMRLSHPTADCLDNSQRSGVLTSPSACSSCDRWPKNDENLNDPVVTCSKSPLSTTIFVHNSFFRGRSQPR